MRAPYKHDLFYNPITVMPRLEEFKKEVIEKKSNLILEQKYVNGGWREPTDKKLEWILDNCTKVEDVRIVHRYSNFVNEPEMLQITFMYIPDAWYLAWFELDPKLEEHFINKYNLKPLR
jgi:hypothetical protein